ncbi:shikimate 5-dehydrogenase [Mycolicibacterium brumae]|uniref:Shikimate 5-dehydrogenase n=1 Tax=Mycolicibacterium brumae TaxID=85968 RepID=A0A2G5PEY8_9MYCO|nr:shikimate 5-dehydrogenase [Mycolicibacterium brumae]MCV7191920.1 shikimate 5-dehydrogenase [Mycolicibacterium brumae]PIB76866.1 shikimate 5-dehydrogenase [Mycolicibacterium brumae]RWA20590.1 hypothetical protein MBRU_02725 [Mycolicibacterium brumae DSM 44177]UWW07688.1 shikimate 5-dehydrogenase [Mycolicibacterium brumae]
MRPELNKDTTLCISLAARPSNIGTRFHNFLYDRLGLDFVYKAFTTTDIAAAIGGVRALGIRGCSVSMPFKADLLELADVVEPSATVIGAVNTVVNDGGVLTASNTDYLAVEQLIASNGLDPSRSLLIAGSGGMASAVATAFRDNGFQDGTVVARNAQSGPELAERLGYHWRHHLGGACASILVNVTPIGMAGAPEADDLPFGPEAIEAADTIFDVVAMPAETPLIRAARAAGKQVITGSEVIALQAAEQFERYTGVRPSPELIAEASAYSRA